MDIESLNTTIENLKALRKTLMEQAQTGIKSAFEGFLKAYPQVKTIAWSQYTPYFNDGDGCVFGVNELTFSPMPPDDVEDPHMEDYEDDKDAPFGLYKVWDRDNSRYTDELKDKRITVELYNDAMALSGIVESGDMEDAMKTAFGNHVWVKAYLKGGKVAFDVEEYEHD